MSLVSTLAKVAAGVVVAKGIKGMVSGGSQGSVGRASTGGGLEDMLGQIVGGGGRSTAGTAPGGSLQDVLGQVLGGGTTSRGGSATLTACPRPRMRRQWPAVSAPARRGSEAP